MDVAWNERTPVYKEESDMAKKKMACKSACGAKKAKPAAKKTAKKKAGKK